mmetsp:Transcript_22447/g.56124  ORF Transcript_22447/g.56124 Transcript_22447/m.56124 type:complete len:101 (+) Transcript_22447:153-455(+)
MGQCLGKCLGSEDKGGKAPGGRSNPYQRQESGGGQSLGGAGGGVSAEERRQQALDAAERRAKDQELRGVQGNKSKLSPTKDTPGNPGGKELNLSDAAAWN